MAAKKKMKDARATVLYLDKEVRDAVKYRALTSGMSMAEWVRRAIDQYLERQPKARKAVRP